MSRSSLPRPGRFRRAVAVLAVATLPFTVVACSGEEAEDGTGVVEEEGGEEEDGEEEDD